jgi:hypothetical protein
VSFPKLLWKTQGETWKKFGTAAEAKEVGGLVASKKSALS